MILEHEDDRRARRYTHDAWFNRAEDAFYWQYYNGVEDTLLEFQARLAHCKLLGAVDPAPRLFATQRFTDQDMCRDHGSKMFTYDPVYHRVHVAASYKESGEYNRYKMFYEALPTPDEAKEVLEAALIGATEKAKADPIQTTVARAVTSGESQTQHIKTSTREQPVTCATVLPPTTALPARILLDAPASAVSPAVAAGQSPAGSPKSLSKRRKPLAPKPIPELPAGRVSKSLGW